MYNKDVLDEYIKNSVPSEYTPNMLFILLDVNDRTLKYVYQNPVEIIRAFWKEHLKYTDMDETYRDTLAFLYHKSVSLKYHTAYRKFEKLLEHPETATVSDINDAATLFLIQHSSACPNLLFGYVNLPEQRAMLQNMFESIPLRNVSSLIDHVIRTADDHVVNSIRLVKPPSSKEVTKTK